MPLDVTGKFSFDDIYTAPDPRPYYRTLRELDYQIPQLAKPYLAKLVDEYRGATGIARPTVLDLGCSYGVAAALHRCEASMDDLFDHYDAAADLDRASLVERDRRLVRRHAAEDGPRFLGLDASAPALAYALDAGFLDASIHADFETDDPDPAQQTVLDGVDIVVSSGCVGYVTEKTITRIAGSARPWMAHFVLRMFSYEQIAASLAELGYETASIHGVFRQRRFASPAEQARILATLAETGVDPTGLEADGWLYAGLHVSRPHSAAGLASALNTVGRRAQ